MPTQEGFQVLSNASATAFPPLLLWSSSPAGLPFLNALTMPLFYFLIYILFCSLEITTTTHQVSVSLKGNILYLSTSFCSCFAMLSY